MGEKKLKNIARPVRVYRVRLTGSISRAEPPLTLPDKPSIAVLPFQNLSGDPGQEYFADGITEEITTALARLRGRSEEHTSELQSHLNLVCRLLLEKKKKKRRDRYNDF